MGTGRAGAVLCGALLAAGLSAVAAGSGASPATWVTAWGGAPNLGDAGPAVPTVAVAATPDGRGYWTVGSDGSVYSFGDAAYHGGASSLTRAPIVGLSASPEGGGYWLVAGDGSVYSFGAAAFHGSAAGTASAPVAQMAPTPDGGGYWLVGRDGSVYSFGDAGFHGSAAGNATSPVVGVAATADGGGYWLVGSNGAVYSFGDAGFHGSAAGLESGPIVGISRTPDGGGYWLVGANGAVFSFGDAVYGGGGVGPGPAVGIAASRSGYWIAFGPDDAPMAPEVASFAGGRAGNVTAAVFDRATGRTTVYRPGVVETTASIEKVDILATLMSQAAAAGRGLTAGEQATAASMIQESDNDSATDLWNETAQGVDEEAYDTAVGMPGTAMDPGYRWGYTLTTALDQVTLMRTIAYPGPLLSPGSQAFILDLMSHVDPEQAWGVSAGPGPGDYVALKNGWYPSSTVGPGGWQVNSIGLVQGDGRDYVLAVLTGGDPSEGYGIDTIEGIASAVWAHG
jgi:beta-lactamase family protein